MIRLHRPIGHRDEPFLLNPDLIANVEAHPGHGDHARPRSARFDRRRVAGRGQAWREIRRLRARRDPATPRIALTSGSCAARRRSRRGQTMKATTAIGLVVAFVGLALGATMEGCQLPAFFNAPALMLIVFAARSAPRWPPQLRGHQGDPELYKMAIPPSPDLNARAPAARRPRRARPPRGPARPRRRGLPRSRTPYIQEGPAARRRRHRPRRRGRRPRDRDRRPWRPPRVAAKLFEKAGGFAPTIGIIGTVFGLIHVLEQPRQPRDARPRRSPARSSPRCYGVAHGERHLPALGNRLKGSPRRRSSCAR